MPLVLLDIRGTGTVRIGSQDYAVGSSQLDDLLHTNQIFVPAVEVVDATSPIELTFLLNPRDAALESFNTIRMAGLEVWGLDVRLEDFPTERATLSAPQIPTFPF